MIGVEGHPTDDAAHDGATQRAAEARSDDRVTAPAIRSWLVARLAEELGIAADEIRTDEPFAYYGLDSPTAGAIVGELGDWLGRRIPMSTLYNLPTIDALVAHLVEEPRNGNGAFAALAAAPQVQRTARTSPAGDGIGVCIGGLGVEIPAYTVTTKEVEERARICERFGYKPGWLERSTGVRERRWASSETQPSELATLAGIKALRKAGVDPDTVDAVLFAGLSRDFMEPAVANVVAEGVGARRALAFDVSNACNSLIQALDVADSLIRTGKASRVLIASGERASIGYNWEPSSLDELIHSVAAYMLADGGAALVAEACSDPDRGIQQRVFRTDPSRWRLAIGAPFRPAQPCGTCGRVMDRLVRCNGPEIQEVAYGMMVPVLDEAMARTGWGHDDLDIFFCHEASRRFIDAVLQELGDAPSVWKKLWRIVERYGNTSTISLPLAMSEAEAAGALVRGKRILLAGPGAGITIAGVTMIW
jgi:3-oxoacyl-[acyl-carrier-protein] synthase III